MKMENRNQYNSPRDRIDDALLIRLLNEEEPHTEYTCTGERRSRTDGGCSGSMEGCGTSREWGETRKSCGRNSVSTSRGTRCGCAANRERQDGCGCGSNRERQDSCGCGSNHERQDSCGCGNNRERQDGCGCGNNREHRDNIMPRRENSGCSEFCSAVGSFSGYALAMVYMPDHDFDEMFDEEEALSHGTLFRPLDLPFYPGCGGNCGCR